MLVSVSDTLPDMRERGNLSQLSREKEETCPSSQETSTTLIPKPDKDTKISCEHSNTTYHRTE